MKKMKRPREENVLGQGKVLSLFAYGADLSPAFAKTCKERLGQLGIETCEELTERTAYVVSSLAASQDRLEKWAKGKEKLRNVQIVTIEWMKKLVQLKAKSLPVWNVGYDWVQQSKAKTERESKDSSSAKAVVGDYSTWLKMNEASFTIPDWLNKLPRGEKRSCKDFLMQGAFLEIDSFKQLETKEPNGGSKRRKKSIHEHFACFKSGTDEIGPNLNKNITDAISPLLEYYSVVGDNWRVYSYKKALDTLKTLKFKVKSADQLRNFHGLGKKMLEKVDEVLRTGLCVRALEVWKEPIMQAVREISKIHGIGETRAFELVKRPEIRSVEDLRQNTHLLTNQQKIGLKHFEDSQLRLPRDEVERIGKYAIEKACKIWSDRTVVAQICGSYRRGKHTSGDVDLIFSIQDKSGCPPISELVDALTNEGFLTDHLVKLKKSDSQNLREKQNYMGYCKLPDGKHHRRIDIKMYPRDLYAFALLHFTGSGHFNRSMRNYAKRKGYSMSDEGIFHAVRQGHSRIAKISENIAKDCYTEQDIFNWLGFPYKEPHERNCYDQEIAERTMKLPPMRGR